MDYHDGRPHEELCGPVDPDGPPIGDGDPDIYRVGWYGMRGDIDEALCRVRVLCNYSENAMMDYDTETDDEVCGTEDDPWIKFYYEHLGPLVDLFRGIDQTMTQGGTPPKEWQQK